MKQKSMSKQSASERLVKDIKRKTRKIYSAEEKIRIVLDGLRGEMSISEWTRFDKVEDTLLCLCSLHFKFHWANVTQI